MGDKEHYVHFSSTSGIGSNNIVIQPMRHGFLNVNLGFLQIRHRYHIEFNLPWNTCVIHPERNPSIPAMTCGKENPNCRVINFTQDRDDLRLKVELFVSKEGFLKEPIQITCCEKGSPLTIFMNARIFGKDQGTPLLRNGIRSVAVEDDTERDEDEEGDEASD